MPARKPKPKKKPAPRRKPAPARPAPAPDKGGRPRKDVDPIVVRELATIGCTVAEISAVTGASKRTLERRFAAAIETGRDVGRESLRRLQWAQAKDGNVTMLIWLGKQLLGQTNKILAEHTGEGGGAIRHSHGVDVADLTDDELRDLQRIQKSVAARQSAAAGGAAGPASP